MYKRQMCSIAIVKVGARGSLIRKGTEMVQVQAAPVEKVVDTTGAEMCIRDRHSSRCCSLQKTLKP